MTVPITRFTPAAYRPAVGITNPAAATAARIAGRAASSNTRIRPSRRQGCSSAAAARGRSSTSTRPTPPDEEVPAGDARGRYGYTNPGDHRPRGTAMRWAAALPLVLLAGAAPADDPPTRATAAARGSLRVHPTNPATSPTAPGRPAAGCGPCT